MAVRLDPWKTIVGVGWGSGETILTADFNEAVNPGTTRVRKSGLYASFSAGGPSVDGGGSLNRQPIPGVRIDEMYIESDEDLEHGGDPVWSFRMILAGPPFDVMPPGIITIVGLGSFDTTNGAGVGTSGALWLAPFVPELHLTPGDYPVTWTPA